MKQALVIVLLLGGCVSSNVVQCEDGRTCPEGTVCDVMHALCVTPDLIAQCDGKPDRTRCAISGALGTCHEGVCFAAQCGNGRLDLDMATACAEQPCLAYELCDDSNSRDGDGCSADCLSDETCGNATIDSVNSEVCDDGNRLDHDGCSTSCAAETARWVQVGSPGPITMTRAVYDAARDRVVMVGGRIANSGVGPFTNGVSEWDGMWHRNVPTLIAPAARENGAGLSLQKAAAATYGLAYHHELRMTVIAGGMVNGETTRETWGWDGAAWTRLADLPFPVQWAAMTYDARRKRIVLFGGQTAGSVPIPRDRTLEFDGTTWVDVSPASSPPSRTKAAMAYDPKRGISVMYGGVEASASGELWVYDGSAWTLRVATNNTTHPGMYAPAMAFDSASSSMLIYGDETDTANALLLWDGTNLTVSTAPLPMAPAPTATTSARSGAILVPDGTGRVMLYGGSDRGSFSTQPALLTSRLHWFWDGGQWIESSGEPTAVGGAVAVTLMDQRSVVRFGGAVSLSAGPPATGETWELSRRGWRKFDSVDPPGLVFHAMAYDSRRDEIVMFGGGDSGGQLRQTTWTRSGTNWTSFAPSGNWPVARAIPAMAYDEARGETVMFGGRIGSSPQGDTWTWNGTSWTQKTPANTPSPRSGAALGYDPVHQVVVLFGGFGTNTEGTTADTWIWDGTNWTNITPASSPDPRNVSSLTWNPARQRLVLSQDFDLMLATIEVWELELSQTSPPTATWTVVGVGARPPFRALASSFASLDGSGVSLLQGTGSSGTPVDDHWELEFDASGVGDSCTVPVDLDGDELVACADPDCWRTCTPDCPPGTTCPATGADRCGDGTCGVVENCRTCPADCTTCVDTWCGDFNCDPAETCVGDCP